MLPIILEVCFCSSSSGFCDDVEFAFQIGLGGKAWAEPELDVMSEVFSSSSPLLGGVLVPWDEACFDSASAIFLGIPAILGFFYLWFEGW